MAYVAHHPTDHAVPPHVEWRRNAIARSRAGIRARIDGTWVASLVFGVLVTVSALVFLVPMLIWG
jgi:hypothetical protein